MDYENKPKIRLTPKQALIRGEKYCVYQDRCQYEVKNKLYEWGIYGNDIDEILASLISDDFINEERFACAYVRGKFKIKRWGKIKIKIELQRRDISSYSIKKGLKEINEFDYLDTIKLLIEKKSNTIKGGKPYERNHKIAQYIATKGFEKGLVYDILKGTI